MLATYRQDQAMVTRVTSHPRGRLSGAGACAARLHFLIIATPDCTCVFPVPVKISHSVHIRLSAASRPALGATTSMVDPVVTARDGGAARSSMACETIFPFNLVLAHARVSLATTMQSTSKERDQVTRFFSRCESRQEIRMSVTFV